MSWTDARIETLKKLWNGGLSASKIARALGGGLTRNAVIGKVHRLGLKEREPPPAFKAKEAPKPPPKVEKIAEPEPDFAKSGERITMLNVSDRTCRWPVGNPGESDFHFCGRKPKTGSPYCEPHARKAYQPQSLRRRS